MRGILASAAIAALTGMSGCTHLEVNRYAKASDPASGYAYMLDFTQFQVTLTRTLSECVAGEMPVVTAEAKVVPVLSPDGAQVYVIDPSSMISAFKTSDVVIDYKDGRLVGFNTSTVDKTGEVAASVINTAGKIAMLAAVPIPVASGQQYCSDSAVAKLKLLSDNKGLIKDATAKIEIAQSRLAVLTAKFAAAPTMKLQKQMTEQTAAIKTARGGLDGLTTASIAAQAWLTNTATFTWPETSVEFHREAANSLGPGTVARWFDVSTIRISMATRPEFNARLDENGHLLVAGPDGSAERLGVTVEDFKARFPKLAEGTDFDTCTANRACNTEMVALTQALLERNVERVTLAPVSLHILRRGSYGSETASSTMSEAKAGIRYRVPAAGSLYVCVFDEPCQTGRYTPLSRTDSAVAQLGTVFNIPFSSPAFASGGMSLKFDDQGRMLQAGLKRDTSVALGVATAAGAAVDEVSKAMTAKERAAITKAENATKLALAEASLAKAEEALVKSPQQLATEELNLLKTQQELATVRAALGPDRGRDLSKQIEITKLELQLAQLERDRVADPNADVKEVREGYDAQAEMLTALRASRLAELGALEAQQALDQAKNPAP